MCCCNSYNQYSNSMCGGWYSTPVSYTCYPVSVYNNGCGCGCGCGGYNGFSSNSLALIALYSLLCR